MCRPIPKSSSAATACLRGFAWGFTLLELLVAMAVVAILMLIMIQATSITSNLWKGSTDKIKSFQSARAAFDAITQTLSQATLNTFYEYYDATGNRYTGNANFTPVVYDRGSELHFVSAPATTLLSGVTRNGSPSGAYSQYCPGSAVFFQALQGYTQDPSSGAAHLDSTLNTLGYFVEFGSDQDFLPSFLDGKVEPRYRYRLMQFFQPTENMSVYKEAWAGRAGGTKANWFSDPLTLPLKGTANNRPASVLAENVLYLVLRPKRSDKEYAAAHPKPTPIAPNYTYDSRPQAVIPLAQAASFPSRHQLPPIVAVTLVAIDETSAIRLQNQFGTTPPLAALGIANLFQNTADTNDPALYQADLNTLKQKLADNNVTFRIFETEVMLQASKWTQ